MAGGQSNSQPRAAHTVRTAEGLEDLLSLIRRHGPLSRAALAQAMDLSPQAITNLSRKLIEQGGAKLNDAKIMDIDMLASSGDLTDDGYIKLSAGKKKHALVRVKS